MADVTLSEQSARALKEAENFCWRSNAPSPPGPLSRLPLVAGEGE
jgi:hypothetical protein